MSFAGGGASNSGGSTSFSRSQIQGETNAFTGALESKVRRQRVEARRRQEMEQDTKFQDDIRQGQLDIIDKFIDETIGDPSNEVQDNLNDHLNALLLIQMLEKDVQIEDADTYYSLLDKYDIEAEFDDVRDFQTQATKRLTENFLADINDVFDAIGKVDALEGADAIENIGEATSDIIEAIVKKNPKYAVAGVAEALGIEFQQDEEGNLTFDLRNTIIDNVRPIMQKIMARYVINPLKNMVKGWGATTEELEAHLEPLLEEIVEEEAPLVEASLGEELAALAETETLALPGIIIGGIQGTTAILRAIGGVLQAINLSHDAYTKKNHTWADQNSGFVKFVKKIPLVNELAESIAELIAEAKDMRAYRRGETDRQKFNEEYESRIDTRDEQEEVLGFLSNGTITFQDIEDGKQFSFYRTDEWGKKTVETIDLSKYKLEKLREQLADDIDALKVDGEKELNNLISYYEDETDKMLDGIPKSLRDTLQFRDGQIVGWDQRRVADMTKTVSSKDIGDVLFRGGKKTVPISQEEFLAYIRNYNDFITATDEAEAQIQQLERLSA